MLKGMHVAGRMSIPGAGKAKEMPVGYSFNTQSKGLHPGSRGKGESCPPSASVSSAPSASSTPPIFANFSPSQCICH